MSGRPVCEQVTYQEFDQSCRALAAWLNSRFPEGERALLLHTSGSLFAVTLLACLYAGLVPVVAPIPNGRDHHRAPATRIAFDADVAVVLTDGATLAIAGEWLGQEGLDRLPLVATDVIPLDEPDGWVAPVVKPWAPALLTYDEDTPLGAPGTVLTHGDLLATLRRARTDLALTERDRICGWLPVWEGPSGLDQIMSVLLPLWLGATAVRADHHDRTDTARRWLWAAGQGRADVLIGPASAFQRCLTSEIDTELSAVRTAVCFGARRAREVAGEVAVRYAPVGLRPGAVRAAYAHQRTHSLLWGTERERLRLMDPRTRRPVAEGAVGEIWVRRESGESPHSVRTGDLGRVLDGELEVLGRVDDTVEIQGRRRFMDTVVSGVERLDPAFGGLFGTIFGLPGARDEIVLVHEVHTAGRQGADLRRLAAKARGFLRGQVAARAVTVIFVRPGGVPRLCGGAANLPLVRQLFTADALEPVHQQLVGREPAVIGSRELC